MAWACGDLRNPPQVAFFFQRGAGRITIANRGRAPLLNEPECLRAIWTKVSYDRFSGGYRIRW
jgi:hypothetical protein